MDSSMTLLTMTGGSNSTSSFATGSLVPGSSFFPNEHAKNGMPITSNEMSPLHVPISSVVSQPRMPGKLGTNNLPPSIMIAPTNSKNSGTLYSRTSPATPVSPALPENAPPPEFAAEVIKLIGLMMQFLGPNYQLKDLCEKTSSDLGLRCPGMFDGGFETLANYLANIVIPLLFRCSSGRKDCPVLSKENIFYALDACITAWFASNSEDSLSLQLSGQKNPASGTQPGGGSVTLTAPFSVTGASQLVEIVTPTSFSCDHPSGCLKGTLASLVDYKLQPESSSGSNLRVQHPLARSRGEGESASMKMDLVQRLGYLGVKLILIAYPRHALARSRRIIAALTKMSHCQHGGLQLWKFVDFLVTYRPPIFPHLLAFIHLKGEQAFQQVVNQKLIGLHMPPPKTPVNVLRGLMNDLRQIRIEFTQTRRVIPSRSLLEVSHHSQPDPLHANDSDKRVLSSRKSAGSKNKPHEYTPKPSCKIIPSLASDSATTSINETQQGPEAMFGLPTSTQTSGKNLRKISLTDSNNIRKCLLRQRSGKRIKATDGSRIICRHQSLSNRQPILTASVESLPRNSYNYTTLEPDTEPPESAVGMGSKLRRAGTSLSHCGREEGSKTVARLVPIATAVPVGGPTDPDGTKSDSLHLTNPGSGQNATELVATAGSFTVAAHVAQSLFGSAAPYNKVRETAKDELCHLLVDENQDGKDDEASLSGPEVAEILEAQAKKEIEERSKSGKSASSVSPVVRYV